MKDIYSLRHEFLNKLNDWINDNRPLGLDYVWELLKQYDIDKEKLKPNELQDVNNNELTQEVCGLCNGDKWITTPYEGKPCPACGGTGLKQTGR